MVARGEVWWASLAHPRGSEPGFERPVVIVQDDRFNKSKLSTVVVATITSNLQRAEAPGNVRLTRRESGLPRESVVNVTQVSAIDRADLQKRSRKLPAERMRDIDNGLRLVLNL